MVFDFYSSSFPEYYWQKPHYNLGNKFFHSTLYKKLNPLRIKNDYDPNGQTQMPIYLGVVPQISWLYGNLDYSYHKYHRHYQAHDEWYPDRKNKSLGFKNGGFCEPTKTTSKYMTLQPEEMPRGCAREVRAYKMCTAEKGSKNCFNEKIAIMEVCPDHVLSGLREKKKWFLRAQAIDNQTYRRAMSVSDYNKGRTVTDLKLKTWVDGTAKNLRGDTYWADDRYDPTKYRHPHRKDSVNFPDMEYKDIFGGNWGEAALKEKENHALNFWSGKSKAMEEVEAKKTA